MTSPGSERPVIFLAFANDRDDYLDGLARELHGIQDVALASLKSWEILVRTSATLDVIVDRFQNSEYRGRIAIFHYAGHANGYSLLLKTDAGKNAPALAGGFAAFLAQQRGLRLVVLNGCATQSQVQGLLDAGIPSVIATSAPVEDADAIEFAQTFYRGLAGGNTVRSAFAEATAVRATAGATPKKARKKKARGAVNDHDEELTPRASLWELSSRQGTDNDWTLGDIANDPSFGLPELPARDLPGSPYVHLRWFTREEAELFFGRGREIRALFNALTRADGAPIHLLHGQSGVGKSSLLDAGLLPRLGQVHDVVYLRRRSDVGCLETLAAALGTAPEGLAAAWLAREGAGKRPLTIVLDQVEEAFTASLAAGADQEIRTLCEGLRAVFGDADARPRGKLVLSFRKEWFAEVDARLEETKLPRAATFIERLTGEGIVEVIMGPVRSQRLRDYRLQIEDGLAQVIAGDLEADRGSPIAPVLQILLSRMWKKAKDPRTPGGTPSTPRFYRTLYEEMQKEGTLLDDFVDTQIASLRATNKEMASVVDSGFIWDYLHEHVTDLGTARDRTHTQLRETYSHRAGVLDEIRSQLVALYVLVEPPGETAARGEPTTRLAHDALGPLVKRHFQSSIAPGPRARRILENRRADWMAPGGIKSVLDDTDLRQVELGEVGMRAQTAVEQQLVKASQLEREIRQKWRRRRQLFAAIAIALVVLSSGFAWWQSSVATKKATEARARELAALSGSKLSTRLDHALALSVAAMARDSSTDASQNALLAALGASKYVSFILPEASVRTLAISPDGRWVARGGRGTIELWDLVTGMAADTVSATTGTPDLVTFDETSRRIAIADDSGGVVAYDLTNTDRRETLLRPRAGWELLSFGKNGRHAVYLNEGRFMVVPLWREDRSRERTIEVARPVWDNEELETIVSAGGQQLIIWQDCVYSRGGAMTNCPWLELRDLETGRRITAPTPRETAALSLDGGFSATLDTGAFTIRDIRGKQIAAIPSPSPDVRTYALGPRARSLAAAFGSGDVVLWRINAEGQVARSDTVLAIDDAGAALMFSANGRYLVVDGWSAGAGGAYVLQLWSTSLLSEPNAGFGVSDCQDNGVARDRTPQSQRQLLWGATMSGDGTAVALLSYRGCVVVHNLSTGARSFSLRVNAAEGYPHLSRNGRHLAVGIYPHTIKSWSADGAGRVSEWERVLSSGQDTLTLTNSDHLAISDDGLRVAVIADGRSVVSSPRGISRMSADVGALRHRFVGNDTLLIVTRSGHVLSWHPDKPRIDTLIKLGVEFESGRGGTRVFWTASNRWIAIDVSALESTTPVVQLWDRKARRLMFTLGPQQLGRFNELAITPEEDTLVAFSWYGQVSGKIPLTTKGWLDLACARTGWRHSESRWKELEGQFDLRDDSPTHCYRERPAPR